MKKRVIKRSRNSNNSIVMWVIIIVLILLAVVLIFKSFSSLSLFGSLSGNVAKTATCVDGDSGLNYNVKGTISNKYATAIDRCNNATSVVEYYCLNSKNFDSVIYSCQGGRCSDGACVY